MEAWILTVVALVAAGVLSWLFIQTRRQLDQQADEASQLREGLLDAVDDSLLVLDSNQLILCANSAAKMLLGSDIVSKKLIEVLPHSEIQALTQDAQIVRGESVERQIEFDRRILNVRAVMIQNEHRNIEVLALRDVTEIQRLERARREMVSNISHELSTPITSIGLMADTLLNSVIKEKPKRLRKMTADIRREVDTLTQLVQEMRDLSLIESGQMPVRLTPTDLLSVIQASVEPMLPLAENKNQSINVNIPDAINVLADETQLQRAIKNIVHNAVKFSPEGANIDVCTTTNTEEAIISVKDQGPGIPANDLPRIFERFFQVDRARRGGTGLGLAIVRHIVLAHGGRVWVESVEGHGATFYIALVLSESQASL
jgi:two-component system phosphate regulon sensor histidine kinase PhoR